MSAHKNILIAFSFLFLFNCMGCDNDSSKHSSYQSMVESSNTTNIYEGQTLFLNNCSSCHLIKKDLTGPALAGVNSRWPDRKKLHNYIHNAPAYIKTDIYVQNLYKKYNQVVMTPFPSLTDNQIDLILYYIEAESK